MDRPRRRYWRWIVPGIVLGSALGLVQVASMALYGDLAVPGALPARLPAALGVTLGRPLGAPFMPAFARGAYAGALIHRAQIGPATAILAALPAGSVRADLLGQLAELDGDRRAALANYVRAADVERAQRLIDARVDAGDVAGAAGFEVTLLGELQGSGQTGVRARVLWRLGQITQEEAVRSGMQRTALERAALTWYDEALALAPNEETYLLAAGEQALTLGDRARAARYYERALAAVPNSADARAGLARAQP
jgi:tetratricopeptide (TPR) repeat protein